VVCGILTAIAIAFVSYLTWEFLAVGEELESLRRSLSSVEEPTQPRPGIYAMFDTPDAPQANDSGTNGEQSAHR
jgi:hypothetical protein